MTGPTLAQQRQFAERMKQLTAAIDRAEAVAEKLDSLLKTLRESRARKSAS